MKANNNNFDSFQDTVEFALVTFELIVTSNLNVKQDSYQDSPMSWLRLKNSKDKYVAIINHLYWSGLFAQHLVSLLALESYMNEQ